LIEKSTAAVHNQIDFIRFLYLNPEKHPTGLDMLVNPIAVYDRDGNIVNANKDFRKISDIAEDDIRGKGANLFEYLNNTENEGLTEAAKTALYNGTKYFEEIKLPLLVKTARAAKEMALYTKAAFFPITHNRDGSVKYGAMLLAKEGSG